MTSRAALHIACAFTLIALAVPTGTAELQQEWRRYDLAAGGPFVATAAPVGDPPLQIGGVEFAADSAAAQVYVQVNDDTGSRVAARYLFAGPDGTELTSGDFCRSTTVSVPAEAATLWVYPSMLITPCPLGGPYGPAVAGTVYLRWLA